jgi:hypothetical protein
MQYTWVTSLWRKEMYCTGAKNTFSCCSNIFSSSLNNTEGLNDLCVSSNSWFFQHLIIIRSLQCWRKKIKLWNVPNVVKFCVSLIMLGHSEMRSIGLSFRCDLRAGNPCRDSHVTLTVTNHYWVLESYIVNLYPELSFVPHLYLCQCLKIGKFIPLVNNLFQG